MKNASLIHGWGANSRSNWFPWLKEELEKKGFKVNIPDFPNAQHPQLSQWLKYFEENVSIDQDTILIGHSLGVPFILRFLEGLSEGKKAKPRTRRGVGIKAAFLISGFERSLGFTETENFVDKPFNWQKIKKSSDKFFVINSDNDPYIPLNVAKNLAKSLGVKLMVEHNAGHINAPGGFLAYPRLLKLILHNT